MKFHSTAGNAEAISFKDAVLNNLPDDGGLYFPSEIPQVQEALLKNLKERSLHEVAYEVLWPFCKESIGKGDFQGVIERVFDFPIPLVNVKDGIQCLELFHGPTYAFKDIGARFLAECLGLFTLDRTQPTKVLVATSGDTGGAVANGFLGVEGVDVVILYPKGKVSQLQEKQLTTLGQNITALEVEGTFDDCQNMVKQAFNDEELNKRLHLSSANSINIARWLPQSLFYWVPLMVGFKDFVVAVPSGNYGNLTAGVLAMKMGVPIRKFIAASNANDVVPRYLQSGSYEPKPTIATIANAMDVSDPSNFKRLLTLFEGSFEEIRRVLEPFTLQDAEISTVIRTCQEQNNYLLDPHSAIGYESLRANGNTGVFLGTAHYCKFLPTMNEALASEIEIPDFANELMNREKKSIPMQVDYEAFRDFLTAS